MIIDPDTTGADGDTARVTDSPGEREQWYLWNDAGDLGDVEGEVDRLQLTEEFIKTDTLLELENCR